MQGPSSGLRAAGWHSPVVRRVLSHMLHASPPLCACMSLVSAKDGHDGPRELPSGALEALGAAASRACVDRGVAYDLSSG